MVTYLAANGTASNGADWNSGTQSGTWNAVITTDGTATVNANQLRMTGGTGQTTKVRTGSITGNCGVKTKFTYQTTGGNNGNLEWWFHEASGTANNADGYFVQIDQHTTLNLYAGAGGTYPNLASTAFSFTLGTQYDMEVTYTDNGGSTATLNLYVWASSGSKPGSPTLTYTGGTGFRNSGFAAFHVVSSGVAGEIVDFDDVQITDGPFVATSAGMGIRTGRSFYPGRGPRRSKRFHTTDMSTGNLSPWYEKLPLRSSVLPTWLAIGDSFTEGQGASVFGNRWVSKAIDYIRNGTPGSPSSTGGTGWIAAASLVVGPDSVWSAPTAQYTGSAAYGYFWQTIDGRAATTNAINDTIVWTVTGTAIDIWLIDSSATGTVKIDAGGPVALLNGGSFPNLQVQRVSLGSAGSHTVTLTQTGAGVIGVDGVVVYNGDEASGTRLYGTGHYGALLSDLMNDWGTGDANTYLKPLYDRIAPDVTTVAFGANEFLNNINPATFYTGLNSLLTLLSSLAKVPDVVLLAFPVFDDGTTHTYRWTAYRDAMQNAVANFGNPRFKFLDLSPYFVSPGSGINYSSDGLHWSDVGHNYAGQIIGQYLTYQTLPNPIAGPATVVGTTSIPAPTVTSNTNATANPATVVGVTTAGIPAVPTFPAKVAGVTTIGQPSFPLSPSTVASATTVAQPTLPVSTSTVQGVTTVGNTSTSSGVSISAAVVNGVTTIPIPVEPIRHGTVAGATTVPATTIPFRPGNVAGLTTVPAPTINSSTKASPGVVAGITTIPTPMVTTGNTSTPATVAGVTTIPTPTITTATNTTATPATVAGVTAVGSPTVSAGGSSTANPSTVGGVVSSSAPTVTVGTTVGPTTVQGAAQVNLAAIKAGTSLSSATVAGSTAVGSPTVTAGSTASANPATVLGSTSIGTPGHPSLLSTVAGATSIGTPNASISYAASPATVAGTTIINTPSASSSGAVLLSTIMLFTTVPASTVRSSTSISVATVTGTTTIGTPAVSIGAGTVVSPSTVLGVTNIGVPTTVVGGTSSPVTVAAATAVPLPSTRSSTTSAPSTVNGITTIGAPTKSVGVTKNVNTVNAFTSILMPSTLGQRNIVVTSVVTVFTGPPVIGRPRIRATVYEFTYDDATTVYFNPGLAMDANRDLTHIYIAENPIDIVLTPHAKLRTGTGGYTMNAGAPRAVQTARMIEGSVGVGSGLPRTADGYQEQDTHMLLMEWDAIVEVDDTFVHDAIPYTVVGIMQNNGYSTRAQVMRRA